MKLRSLLPIAFGLTILAGCKSAYDLKFNPKTGTKYQVQMITDANTEQEVMGQKMNMNSISEMNMTYEVAKAEGDSKELKITFESMKTTQKANGRETIFDTKNSDTVSPGSKMLGAMMGSQFIVSLNSKGEVTSVKGMEEMMKKIVSAASNGDSVMNFQISAAAKNFMSDEIMRNMMEQSFKIFPEGKIKQGDSWKKEMVIKQPMPMNIATKFTLKDVKNNIAKLDLASTITPGKGGMQMMGMTIETELNGTQQGTMDVEMETGMVLATDLKQNISGNMKAMGQEIPMKVQTTITLKAMKL